MSVRFTLHSTDAASAARRGRLDTPHGPVETPAFMPVGTQATIKGLTIDQVRTTGAQMILGNTYHLALRPGVETVRAMGLGKYQLLIALTVLYVILGCFLEGVSMIVLTVAVVLPMATAVGIDPVWFGILITMKVAIGQFTPPMAVNLMVSCRIAGIPMEATLRWVFPLILAMFVVLILLVIVPDTALWLPRYLGYVK